MNKQELYEVVEDVLWFRLLWGFVIGVIGIIAVIGGIAIACAMG